MSAAPNPVQSPVGTGSPPAPPLPKVFLVAEGQRPWVSGYALAEDGTWLASHISSTRGFAHVDMQTPAKRAIYAEHYPNGYTIVDYIEDRADALDQRADYVAALLRSEAPLPDDVRRESAA